MNVNVRRRIRCRNRQRAAAQRQVLLLIAFAITAFCVIFEMGYLYRQITHPERELIIQTVDYNGEVHTAKVRYGYCYVPQ